MHEPILALPPLVGLATAVGAVGVGALMRMKTSARSGNRAHEQMTQQDTDQPARARDEEAPK
jgi:hypothetical protein